MENGSSMIHDCAIVTLNKTFVLFSNCVVHVHNRTHNSRKLLITSYFCKKNPSMVVDPNTYIQILIKFFSVHVWKWFCHAFFYGSFNAIHWSYFIHIHDIKTEGDILVHLSGFRWHFNSIFSHWLGVLPKYILCVCAHSRFKNMLSYVDVFSCDGTVMSCILT